MFCAVADKLLVTTRARMRGRSPTSGCPSTRPTIKDAVGLGTSGRGQHGLIGIDDESLHSRRYRKTEARLVTFGEYPAQIDLAVSYGSVHRHAAHEIVRRVGLEQSCRDDWFSRAGREARILNIQSRKRCAIHPSIEEPVKRFAFFIPKRLRKHCLDRLFEVGISDFLALVLVIQVS